MRFSIRTLLLFTTTVAVTAASLSYANPIIGDLYYTLGLLTIAFATLAAIYRHGPQRAYWVGFVVLFAGYFCHTVWPSEVRGTWNMMQQVGNLGITTSSVSTTRLLNGGFELLHGSPTFSNTSRPFDPRSPRRNSHVEQYMAYMTIGHTAIAFLIGVIGGAVARRIALQSAKTKEEQTERGVESSPDNAAYWLNQFHNGTPQEREAALHVIVAFVRKGNVNPPIIDALCKAATDKGVKNRLSAVSGLDILTSKVSRAKSVLEKLAKNDPDPDVRSMAQQALDVGINSNP